MSKLLAALTVLAALILFAPPPAAAASRTDGVKNVDQYEVSSQRRRYHRRHVHYRRHAHWRPIYRPWRPYWGQRVGWRRAYWGPAYGFHRPWRPYYQPWGYAGYRPWGYRPWGWGHRPGITVSFGFGRPYGGWWW